jgi:hypothetical protein
MRSMGEIHPILALTEEHHQLMIVDCGLDKGYSFLGSKKKTNWVRYGFLEAGNRK